MACRSTALLFAVAAALLGLVVASAVEANYSRSASPRPDDGGGVHFGRTENYSNIDSFGNSSPISCDKVGRSIDEFPPDFFTEEQRRNGAVVIHLLVAFYGFLFITFVCHDYFLPSVFCICLDLGISPDVAGATFMAAATCTSELFVSVIGTFLTKSDLGVGTVVGSGVYNTLGVSACAGLSAAGRAVTVHKWPLLRDSGVYVTSIAVLAAIAVDNVVVWYEALTMMAMYFGYFLFLFAQDRLAKAVGTLKTRNSHGSWTVVSVYVKKCSSALFCRKFYSEESQNIVTLHKNDEQPHYYGTVGRQPLGSPTITIMTTDDNEPNRTDVEEEKVSSPAKSFGCDLLLPAWWTFCLPATLTLSLTVPDCRTKRKLYPLTFVMSIIWISGVTYVLSWMLAICGDTFRISDIVMGIGVLAFGSSLPEVISGIINARNGEGSMIVSSALGSNTMDILLCLGLPWTIKTCLLPASMDGGPVVMETDSLFFNCMCMIASVVVLDVAVVVSGFEIHKPFGVMCLVGQLVVITVLIVNGLKVAKDAVAGRC